MFFLRKVSNPGSLFLWLMDGVLSCVTAPELQEDWLGTKDEIGYFTYQHEFISISCLSTGATRYPGHGTRIARGFIRYKGEKGSFNSSHL